MKKILTILTALVGMIIPANAIETATESAQNDNSTTTVTTQQLQPIQLTAEDLITKVYGILDKRLTKQQLLDASRMAITLIPEEDEYGLWLESDEGYVISYRGMTPEVSARAAYADDKHLSDFGFFFLFPYEGGDRDNANSKQAVFTGTLLQEIMDLGLDMSQDTVSDALFEVSGDYNQDMVGVRLIEEHNTADNSGRFILILSVSPDNPDAYTAEK